MTYRIQLPNEPGTFDYCVGFDPGTTNIGLASIYPETSIALLYEITVIRDDNAINRIKNLHHILFDIGFLIGSPLRVCIEGSAFSRSAFRQVELAEIRTSCYFWFSKFTDNIKIVPPNTIRKDVFGNGKTAAHEVWEGIPKDALAALSCAYHASHW